MFTKKHYIALAEVLKDCEANTDVCDPLADMLLADNPSFDRVRFLIACGINENIVRNYEKFRIQTRPASATRNLL
jgi:hypothetical protein